MERKLEQFSEVQQFELLERSEIQRIRLGRAGKEWRIIGLQWGWRRRLGIQGGECTRFSKQGGGRDRSKPTSSQK